MERQRRKTEVRMTGSVQERNTADRETGPAPAGLEASVWKHFGFYKVDGKSEPDKSHAVLKLCHTKIKSKHL